MKWVFKSVWLLVVLYSIARAQVAAQPDSGSARGTTFKDCADCPEMVVIPAGGFMMGAAPGDEERAGLSADFRHRSEPQHAVNVRQVAVGKFEITRGQFRTSRRLKPGIVTLGTVVCTRGPRKLLSPPQLLALCG